MQFTKSANIVLTQCMGLKASESILIVTDSRLYSLANLFYKKALGITRHSKIITTIIPEFSGVEPPEKIAKEMLDYDIILLITAKSLSHTNARKNASLKGARIASMPGLTKEMARALNVDYDKIKENNQRLFSFLKNKKTIKIKTTKGTDIEFNFEGRKWLMDNGIYAKKGDFGNLPAGEVFAAPLEGKTNGIFVVDASIAGLGIVDRDVKVYVKDGFATKVEGGKIAKKLEEQFKEKSYRNIAELGIGTNPGARISGNVLEDEKVLGTCHIAFGNNKHFYGKVDVPFHVDCVIKNPFIYADKKIYILDYLDKVDEH